MYIVGGAVHHGHAVRLCIRLRPRHSSTYSHLINELTSRELPLLYDNPVPLPSHLLSVTLSDFLPPHKIPLPSAPPPRTPVDFRVPPTHHLIYFPPASRLAALLPDGTDPEQSPGEPYVRRMWAGGRMNFIPSQFSPLKASGNRVHCVERISNVSIKGHPGDEKIFVTIERRVGHALPTLWSPKFDPSSEIQDRIRNSYSTDQQCSVIEHRDLVFMRERSPQQAADAANAPSKVVKPHHEPTYSHLLTPTAALLFRFSALTFNAHRIHLDQRYCQEVEGHRNLLVHGPLSVVLMVELLRRHLSTLEVHTVNKEPMYEAHDIVEIEYRNLAPLYAEEEMRVCGRSKDNGVWDVWIEGRDGGYAVRGTVKTMPRPKPTRLSAKKSKAKKALNNTEEKVDDARVKQALATYSFYKNNDPKPSDPAERRELEERKAQAQTIADFSPYLRDLPDISTTRSVPDKILQDADAKRKAIDSFTHYVSNAYSADNIKLDRWDSGLVDEMDDKLDDEMDGEMDDDYSNLTTEDHSLNLDDTRDDTPPERKASSGRHEEEKDRDRATIAS